MDKVVKDKNIQIVFIEGEENDVIDIDILFKTVVEFKKEALKNDSERKQVIKDISEELNAMLEDYFDELQKELEVE